MRAIILVVAILNIVGCDIGKSELDHDGNGVLEKIPSDDIFTIEDAKEVCVFQLSKIFDTKSNSVRVQQGCSCIVSKVPLQSIISENEREKFNDIAIINRKGVIEANKSITNACIGN